MRNIHFLALSVRINLDASSVKCVVDPQKLKEDEFGFCGLAGFRDYETVIHAPADPSGSTAYLLANNGIPDTLTRFKIVGADRELELREASSASRECIARVQKRARGKTATVRACMGFLPRGSDRGLPRRP